MLVCPRTRRALAIWALALQQRLGVSAPALAASPSALAPSSLAQVLSLMWLRTTVNYQYR